MTRTGWFKALILVFTLTFILAGCGSAKTDEGASENNDAQQGSEAPANNEPAEEESEVAPEEPTTRTIQHAMGEAVIEGVPQRIVVLEWTYAEDLLALGVEPVGVADIGPYSEWVTDKAAIPATVTDVGGRAEPNLETIMSLEPDLIITTAMRSKNNYEELKAIAPTIVFDPYGEASVADQYGDMITSFQTIADIVGKNTEAEQILSDLEATYADAKSKLEAAGKAGETFVLTQAFSNQNAAVLRIFTDNSISAHVLTEMGLANAYQFEQLEPYGFSTASVESLPALQDANFLYVVQDADNVFENQLKDNDVWKSLTFVKEGRLYALGGDMWLFGGPVSVKAYVEKVVELMTQ